MCNCSRFIQLVALANAILLTLCIFCESALAGRKGRPERKRPSREDLLPSYPAKTPRPVRGDKYCIGEHELDTDDAKHSEVGLQRWAKGPVKNVEKAIKAKKTKQGITDKEKKQHDADLSRYKRMVKRSRRGHCPPEPREGAARIGKTILRAEKVTRL